MIKKCKVKTRNTINMVILYNDVEVQLPTDYTCNEEVYVNKIGNGFTLSSQDEFNKSNKKKQKKLFETELVNVDENITNRIIK